ncbi:hypothetical protein CC78DRAFT_582238 [Lojkania enalia]|uniref:Uncharacterized protein n=1 Tax=Lojkania enalia TaxID=147567 RepID=A0A9P4KA29_9PLEO|nr:hypothetical protein CC78DRAFT_582238 [Didymosphaeria enalia]
MVTSGSHTGSNAGDAVSKGIALVHGAGEALRGNINASIDRAAGDQEAAAKNEIIASRGANEMNQGYYHGTGAGVSPADTAPKKQNRMAQGEYTADSGYTGPTNYGPHSTNTGNKLDPRYDSDLDHRGPRGELTYYGPHQTNVGNKIGPRYDPNLSAQTDGSRSANYGPHSTNVSNKVDPPYGSDMDYGGTNEGSTNYGPHSTNIGNKLDPRYDPDQDHRNSRAAGQYIRQATLEDDISHSKSPSREFNKFLGIHAPVTEHAEKYETPNRVPHRSSTFNNMESQVYSKNDYDSYPNYGYDSRMYDPPPQRRDSDPMHSYMTTRSEGHNLPDQQLPVLPKREPQHHPPPHPYEVHEALDQESRRHPPHSTRVMNVLDPRVKASTKLGEPHGTEYPHRSGILNVLDPRVDSRAVRRINSQTNGVVDEK